MNVAGFSVRAATLDDLTALVRLESAAFGDAAWGEARLHGSLASSTTSFVLASRGDVAAGFAGWRIAADEAELLTIGVAPEARRGGCARLLLDRAAGAAARAGARALFLEVSEDNAAARALYAAVGYEPIGARKGYYRSGATALQLRKVLSG
ncbi:MAG: ribosomal protein S18-alanine N-acetyltransferase [Pseudomonadota bacterium]